MRDGLAPQPRRTRGRQRAGAPLCGACGEPAGLRERARQRPTQLLFRTQMIEAATPPPGDSFIIVLCVIKSQHSNPASSPMPGMGYNNIVHPRCRDGPVLLVVGAGKNLDRDAGIAEGTPQRLARRGAHPFHTREPRRAAKHDCNDREPNRNPPSALGWLFRV
jgi:hypothetical protein